MLCLIQSLISLSDLRLAGGIAIYWSSFRSQQLFSHSLASFAFKVSQSVNYHTKRRHLVARQLNAMRLRMQRVAFLQFSNLELYWNQQLKISLSLIMFNCVGLCRPSMRVEISIKLDVYWFWLINTGDESQHNTTCGAQSDANFCWSIAYSNGSWWVEEAFKLVIYLHSSGLARYGK